MPRCTGDSSSYRAALGCGAATDRMFIFYNNIKVATIGVAVDYKTVVVYEFLF